MSDENDPDPVPRARIRELNDQLRTRHIGGKILVTPGIQSLPGVSLAQVLDEVRRFDRFTPDNDPYGEHDFGNLEIAGAMVFFKIDYYDPSGTKGSEDPADPDRTLRVLTVLLAEEY